MKHVSAIFFIVLLALVSVASADELWSEARFETLEGTLDGFTVQTAANGLAQRDSTYIKSLEVGEHWECITQILHSLAEVDEGLNGMDLSGDPSHYRNVREHSGHSWSFWYGLSKVVLEADKFGHEEVLVPDVALLAQQMEDAFFPLLRPQLEMLESKD